MASDQHVAAVATATALLFFGLGACGGGGQGESESLGADATVPCVDDDPGEAATYANPYVAIGRDPRKPVGGELASDRFGGELPWFAKTGLFVRGNREVVVRVPDDLSDAVKIVGWGETNEPREAVLAQPTSACPDDWTAYPGGLAFRGRHCVRLRVEGPGDARGSALVGLRKDCSARPEARTAPPSVRSRAAVGAWRMAPSPQTAATHSRRGKYVR